MAVFDLLVCPEDHTRLLYNEEFLECPKCKKKFKVKEGIPCLISSVV
ncbi:Trm112 family protein [Candidatus Woesearchaeota archaeon]|nr:Trm112 family protein [Candidatus Woesearchaeota archaeon]MBW3016676.1 Trm112 family protein [Candidatus Woesearchaeota archaeon]